MDTDPTPSTTMRKRAAIEFSLRWESSHATHNDRYFIDKVDFWRDLFPGSMGEVLAQAGAGHRHSETFTPGSLVPPRCDRNLVTFRRSLITHGHTEDSPALEPGRYYPKGCFWRPLAAFPGDQTPVRLVRADDTTVVIDANHPLARYPLEVEALVRGVSSISAQRGGSLNDIAEAITADGPGIQAPVDGVRYTLGQGSPLPREDETDDARYYRTPRLVHHLDETARGQVRELYGRVLKGRTRILDLMGSWESHLPDSLHGGHVTGLGMNDQELQANRRLAVYLIHDLNKDPGLPIADNRFDAVVCTASIEYLCRPLEVLSEVARVLEPGGLLVITISERWFPGREVHPWADLHPFERQGVVMNYLIDQGSFAHIETESIRGYPRPLDDKYSGRLGKSDPLYFVWAVCGK